MSQPILQFGTSRFLLAHADLFISEALDKGAAGHALGGVTVVQTTTNPASAARIAELARGNGYPVRIRGLAQGAAIDETVTCHAVRDAWQAQSDWPRLKEAIAGPVRVILSNTGDAGFRLDPRDDDPGFRENHVPHSYPAKLLALLAHRWAHNPQAQLSIFPCELVENNGATLRAIVVALARSWHMPDAFANWLEQHCVWANSLVDRIVSDPIEPVGAVAEPYALWAIERQDRLQLPCEHPAIEVVDSLTGHVQRKLFLLNGAHTFLAERWLQDRRPAGETVAQAMADPALRGELEALWRDEILPVFQAQGQGPVAAAYLAVLRERLTNPYLAHKLADIAQNHAVKAQRRLAPIVALAEASGLELDQARLRACLARLASNPG